MSSPSPSATSATGDDVSHPYNYRIVGILLAVGSGVLIGASFVFKKKGLIASQRGQEAGKGVKYLTNPLWWTGMIMMILGELCNFGAYAFVEAIIVTPLGALSVVICAILSSIFLNERLTFFGWIGCFQCILGSVIIALNGPHEQSVATIAEFKKLFLAPGFLAFGSVVIATSLAIIFFVLPRWGDKHMIWNILVCSLIGGLSVSCTQGLGAAIVTSVRGYNQFKNWFTYFLLGFVAVTLLTEIYFLNVALALFNTAMVTPTYYVIFTFCTLVTSTVLYQGFKTSASQIITVVLGFLVICAGITLLQMSKVDPNKLAKDHNLDRKSTLLFKVAQEEVGKTTLGEKEVEDEDPGVDALRGFNGLAGTLARARRRTTMLDPEHEHHNIYIPGLGRQSSARSMVRPRATSNGSTTLASPASHNGPSLAEQGLLQPNGHNLQKSNTVPANMGGTRPLTSFWHRRTGRGPRKTKVGDTPESTPPRGNSLSTEALPLTTLQLSRNPSGKRTDGGHSLMGESVPEQPEPPEDDPDEPERSMRALLKQQEAALNAIGGPATPAPIPHIRFVPPEDDADLSPPLATSPSDGASPAESGPANIPRSRSPPLQEYFHTPPQQPPLKLESEHGGEESARSSGHEEQRASTGPTTTTTTTTENNDDDDDDDDEGTVKARSRTSRLSESATTARPGSSIPDIVVEGETDRDH